MHIAICDDNVADRKQLERLLKRESEKRKSTTCNIQCRSVTDCLWESFGKRSRVS